MPHPLVWKLEHELVLSNLHLIKYCMLFNIFHQSLVFFVYRYSLHAFIEAVGYCQILFLFKRKYIVFQESVMFATFLWSFPVLKTYAQEDYYDPQYGTLLHSYCTGTYTEVVVLLF